MTIIFRKDAFLYQLFPELKGIDLENEAELEKALRNVSSYEGYTPKVKVTDDAVTIEIGEEEARKVAEQHRRIVQLAENGNFEPAKKLLIPLLEEGSRNADLYRIYGQILEQEGEPAAAMDHLIEALRWNPRNTDALIMMGNIFANYRNDVDTAQLYYNQVVAIEPGNYLALNNIAGVLAKSGKLETALEFFEKARTAQPNYPNTLYGIALTHYHLKDLYPAFDFASQAMKASLQWKERNDALAQSAQGLMMEAAQLIQGEVEAPELFSGLLKELETKTGKRIDVIVDNGIPTAAKIEIAEYRGRSHHIVRYKEHAPGVAHLVMHELIHLELIQEARGLNENKLFTTNDRNREAFWRKAELEKKKMLKGGVD